MAHHVLLDVVLEEALVRVVHQRRGERQQVAGQVLHLLRHLHPGHALADERLVHVDVEEADLGVGDLGQRLPVDAAELEEGDERKARAEDRRDVGERLDVLVGQVVQLPAGRPMLAQKRSISAGSRPGARRPRPSASARSRAPGTVSSTNP